MSQPPHMPTPPPGAVHPNTGALPTQSPGQGGGTKLLAVIITVVALVIAIGGGWWLLTNDNDTPAAIDDTESTEDERDRGDNLETEDEEVEEGEAFVEVPSAGVMHPTKNGWSTSIGDAIDYGYESWYEAPSPINVESDFGVVVTTIIDDPQVGVTLGDQAEQDAEEFILDLLPDADVEIDSQIDASLDDHDIHWSSYDFFESNDSQAREMYAKAIHIDMGDEIIGVIGLTPWGSGQMWFDLFQMIDDVEIMHE